MYSQECRRTSISAGFMEAEYAPRGEKIQDEVSDIDLLIGSNTPLDGNRYYGDVIESSDHEHPRSASLAGKFFTVDNFIWIPSKLLCESSVILWLFFQSD
ncbi:hypothetical protein AYI69_g8103 [Smittium culicis]|uniref:Uncharacterized protein n=1 Tax=Smittium culicis TaxID=133412 RepID=A0A1R1XM62_9FUNG|nr:hypothetical protein AYI69_g8103 [Smittium culicis]